MTSRLRSVYGEHPLHLLGHLAFFALAGYAAVQVAGGTRAALAVALWIAGAAVLHDLVLVPLYAAADRVLRGSAPRPRRRRLINHVRFVAVVAGALAIVWFPAIFGGAEANVERITGRGPVDYLGRFGIVLAALTLLSALAYVVRRPRVEQRDDPVGPAAHEDPAGP